MSGGPAGGDGRLDLDDLGEVIDAATTVDAPRADVIGDDGRRTVRERLDDSGVTPWFRRHRVTIAATTAVVVMAAFGGTAYVRQRPPTLDPQLRVSVTELIASSYTNAQGDVVDNSGYAGIAFDGYVARAAYGVIPDDPADTATYSVLGLIGPAVRASAPHDHDLDAANLVTASDIEAILDCTDRAALDPAPGSYGLNVARTDAWGRTVVGLVPLVNESVSWPAFVSQQCAGQQSAGGLELRGVDVRPGSTPLSLAVDLDVVNTLPIDVTVTVPEAGDYPEVASAMQPTPVAAGATATLPLMLEVRDCTAPTLYPIGNQPWDDPTAGVVPSAPGAYLAMELKTDVSRSGVNPPPQGGSPVHWSAQKAREIDAGLRQLCSGAPARPPALRVSTVGASEYQLAANGSGSTDTVVPVELEVRTPGSRVRAQQPFQSQSWYSGSALAPAVAAVRDGRARLRTTWAYDCQGGGYGVPPTITVVVTNARGAFPFQTQLRSGTLARAILDGCSAADPGQLVESGWSKPSPARPAGR